MILSAQTIRNLGLIENMAERGARFGVSYGLGPASYDVRARDCAYIYANEFYLVATIEKLKMPPHVAARVYSKSTWARQGLLTWNTFIDPGFEGHLTIGLFNHTNSIIHVPSGAGIAQLVFEFLDQPTDAPYAGKYQNQGASPVGAILEETV